MKTIEITISPTGETKIQTRGFAGASCQQATAELERALGIRTADQRTAEYYKQSADIGRLTSGN